MGFWERAVIMLATLGSVCIKGVDKEAGGRAGSNKL
jgi:hypothetical protein